MDGTTARRDALCARCFGTGARWISKGRGWVQLDQVCNLCNGTGWAR